MTTPSSPPNRRRRRIVATIAVLVLGMGWWLWPRVDQRFVGKWAQHWLDKPEYGKIHWDFRADGRVTISKDDVVLQSTKWIVSGGRLFVGSDASTRPIWESLRPWLRRVRLSPPDAENDSCEIRQATDNRIVLASIFDDQIKVLTRLEDDSPTP
jgi:hypothetical protein